MPKLRVHNFSMSADGYCAGPNQTLDDPLGVGGESLHEWMFKTPSGRRTMGKDVPDDEPGGIESALEQATDAANGMDVRIAGGVATVQQHHVTGLVDELRVPIAPVLLGGGDQLFDLPPGTLDRYQDVRMVPSDEVAHVFIRKTD